MKRIRYFFFKLNWEWKNRGWKDKKYKNWVMQQEREKLKGKRLHK